MQGCVTDSKRMANVQEYLLASTLWIQNAGEAKALYYQAFNFAKLRLDEDLKKNKSTKKRAIVVDADETVVDNSPYQAKNYLDNHGYTTTSWAEWVNAAKAPATPGSLEFLRYAAKQGVTVFYITNRGHVLKDSTFKNLKELGFPIKKENLMMKTTTSSKKERREKVLKNYRIILLIGDNLIDFSEIFEHLPTDERISVVAENKNKFGKQFIMLPNPMYGDWEKAIYNYDRKINQKDQANLRQQALRP
ncbi:MAG: 5'-nucleotidase, lipoprotein e(P4) family [Bacteriovoracaceae bacterium]|jgi:5'-nucleotidase (lipoprotein e(P4) family)|nr:5'-nucleotidase, lipoprotein e(P4) family [Bacteriovoracaceae bacterium]